ncbi:MAG TPA: PAS domain S-box protein, partial [Polyangiaceae bacterium]
MTAETRQRVLLVDDEPQVLVALEDLLTDDFVVLKTVSPEMALSLVEQQRDIAVVITDQRMPTMTGDQLLSELGSRSDATRILVTGFADLSAVIRAVNNGKIYAYVTKPWDPEGLRLTVHKAAEHFRLAKELANERQLLRDVVDSIPDGVYFKDRGLRFLRTNRAFSTVLDLDDAGSLLGKTLGDVAPHYIDVAAIERDERRILDDGVPSLDVLRELPRNGSPVWLSEKRAAVRNAFGDIIGIVGVWSDVTYRIRTTEALRVSEERYRSIVETTNEGVWIVDAEQKTTFVNKRLSTLLGCDISDLPNKSILDFVHPDSRDSITKALQSRERGAPGQMEARFTRIDGSDLWALLDSTPVYDIAGRYVGALAMIVDVTHRKRLEDQLRQVQKMEAVGRLAGGIAHDFNNILSVILTYSLMMARELKPGDPIRADLEEVSKAGERAKELTRQLLAFSRQQLLEPRILDLNQVIVGMEKMLRRLLREDIELSLLTAYELGKVRADPSQLEQIVMNLVVNARDAMPYGGNVAIETANVQLDATYVAAHHGVVPGSYVMLAVT